MQWPDDSQRIAIIGRTGSGKTQAAVYHLALRSYTSMPWVIFDWKGEDLIADIPFTQEIGLDETPKKKGLYIVRPLPSDSKAVTDFLWRIWERGRTGVYFDEGYMVGRTNPAYRAILTQGRSKKIPAIVLSQRPVYMDLFTFSEADFFQIFHLNRKRDRETVADYLPDNKIDKQLSMYFSYYYNVVRDKLSILKPVPDRDTILGIFERRLSPKRKFI